jgi:hypothetical protein
MVVMKTRGLPLVGILSIFVTLALGGFLGWQDPGRWSSLEWAMLPAVYLAVFGVVLLAVLLVRILYVAGAPSEN